VTPLGGEPAVVIIEPTNHGSDVEGGVYGVEDEVGAGDAGAVGDHGSGDYGAEELAAFCKAQAFEAAAERVKEDPSRRVKLWFARLSISVLDVSRLSCLAGRDAHGKIRLDGRAVDIVGNVPDLRVVLPWFRHGRGG
jgi:hypothetical protein